MRDERRTKHLDARYFYARDLEVSGDISFKWLSSKDMIVDLMTKSLQGELFSNLTERLMGHAECD